MTDLITLFGKSAIYMYILYVNVWLGLLMCLSFKKMSNMWDIQYMKHVKNHLHNWYQPPSWTGDRKSRWCRTEPRGDGAGGSDPAGGQTRPAGTLSSVAPTTAPLPSASISSANAPGSTARTPPAADWHRCGSPAHLPARSPGTPGPCPGGKERRRDRGQRGLVWPERGFDA